MTLTEIGHIKDQELLSGLIRIHILYHACKEPIFGLGTVQESRLHRGGRSDSSARDWREYRDF
jgi:hypothetical protein